MMCIVIFVGRHLLMVPTSNKTQTMMLVLIAFKKFVKSGKDFGDNIYCDSCGKYNLDAAYRNAADDVDVCETCFNANNPVKESIPREVADGRVALSRTMTEKIINDIRNVAMQS